MLYNIVSAKTRKRVYGVLAVAVPVVAAVAPDWAEFVVAIAAACGFVLARGNVTDY